MTLGMIAEINDKIMVIVNIINNELLIIFRSQF